MNYRYYSPPMPRKRWMPLLPTLATLTNTAEGGSDGTTVTTGNSGGASGTAWDTVNISGTNALAFDDDIVPGALVGAMSYRMDVVDAAQVFFEWDGVSNWTTVQGAISVAFVMQAATSVSANLQLLRLRDTGLTEQLVRVRVNGATQKFEVLDSGGTAQITSTASMPTGSPFRIELIWQNGGVGFRLFTDPDSSTPTEDLSASGTFGTLPARYVQFGHASTTNPNVVTYWDQVRAQNSYSFLGASGVVNRAVTADTAVSVTPSLPNASLTIPIYGTVTTPGSEAGGGGGAQGPLLWFWLGVSGTPLPSLPDATLEEQTTITADAPVVATPSLPDATIQADQTVTADATTVTPSLPDAMLRTSIHGSTYDELVLADLPLGYWPLNDTSGTTAQDATTNNRDLTYDAGVNLGADGPFDALAAEFDGDPQVISRSDDNTFDALASMSVEIWVYLDVLTGGTGDPDQMFMHKFFSTLDDGWYLQRTTGGSLRWTTGGSDQDIHSVSFSFSTGTWYHLVGTFDGPTDTKRIFVDGVQQGADHTWTGTITGNSVALQLGNFSNGSMQLDGRLARAAVYDYALTPGQVRAHFAAADVMVAGVVVATPSLPDGSLTHRVLGDATTVTPSLPDAAVTTTQTVTADAAVSVTPSLPDASVRLTVHADATTVTPSLPDGSLTIRITADAITASPSLPDASVNHRVLAEATSVTPTLPDASVNSVYVVTANATTVTPSLPDATVNHRVAAEVTSVTPSLPNATVLVVQFVNADATTVTPSVPNGSLTHRILGAVLTVTPSLPDGSLVHQVLGVAVTATPNLPDGSLTIRIFADVLTATPSLPSGSLAISGSITADAAVTASPTLPDAALVVDTFMQADATTASPSLPDGSLTHRLTGVAVTATPSLPDASVARVVNADATTVTPSLPDGSLTYRLAGAVVTVVPSLPDGSLTQRITANATTVVPTLPNATVQAAISANATTVTPTLPNGSLTHRLAGQVVTATPTLPNANVEIDVSITANATTVTPTLPDATVFVQRFVLADPVIATPVLPDGSVVLAVIGDATTVVPTLPDAAFTIHIFANATEVTPVLPNGQLLDVPPGEWVRGPTDLLMRSGTPNGFGTRSGSNRILVRSGANSTENR